MVGDGGYEGVGVLDSFLRDMDELDRLDRALQQPSSTDTGTSLVLKTVGSSPGEPVKKCKSTRAKGHVLPPALTKKTPSWLRRKHELAALRQQIQAMETRVAFLQLQRERAQSREAAQKLEAAVSAERQLRRIRAAQDEKEDLKSRLRALAELSRQLQAAISSAMGPTAALACINVPPQLHTSAGSFDLLESRLESRSKDVQVIFDGFKPPVDGVHVEMLNGDAAMEYKLAQTLPFDARMASTAVWRLVEMDCPPQTHFTQIIRHSESSSAVQSRCIIQLDEGGFLVADIRAVMKRFVASEGCVVFIESDTMWSAYSGNEVQWSHASQESIRVLVRRCLLGSGAAHRPVGCHVNALLRSEAAPSDFVTSVDAPLRHAIAMSHCREIIASRRQLLENVIWDSVRAAGKK